MLSVSQRLFAFSDDAAAGRSSRSDPSRSLFTGECRHPHKQDLRSLGCHPAGRWGGDIQPHSPHYCCSSSILQQGGRLCEVVLTVQHRHGIDRKVCAWFWQAPGPTVLSDLPLQLAKSMPPVSTAVGHHEWLVRPHLMMSPPVDALQDRTPYGIRCLHPQSLSKGRTLSGRLTLWTWRRSLFWFFSNWQPHQATLPQLRT
mmetsp:Transcript_17475/g.48713  ORF Transcript_17475/g.48713 Transcript_17475/m.48713 type:complete len:200 (+) Transcript_17475:2527-3126(+)